TAKASPSNSAAGNAGACSNRSKGQPTRTTVPKAWVQTRASAATHRRRNDAGGHAAGKAATASTGRISSHAESGAATLAHAGNPVETQATVAMIAKAPASSGRATWARVPSSKLMRQVYVTKALR